MALVKDIYLYTGAFPKEEIYGLTAQLRRAAVSVPSNIAEGQGRLSRKEFKQFLAVARGSLLEVETQLLIAGELNFLEDAKLEILLTQSEEALKILNGLITSMQG